MYIKEEQELTDYNLNKKLNPESFNPGVEVRFNPKSMSQYSWSLLQQLPKIIRDSGEVGTFELDIFEIKIKSMKTYEKELISAI